ncbi:hypothetical protein MRX96_038621 [Rhipicephalus microplus]
MGTSGFGVGGWEEVSKGRKGAKCEEEESRMATEVPANYERQRYGGEQFETRQQQQPFHSSSGGGLKGADDDDSMIASKCLEFLPQPPA